MLSMTIGRKGGGGFVENQIEVSSRRDNELELTDNAVLARLVRELREEIIPVPAAYNRKHNRHNR
jgi:hypothetical protein